MSSTESFDDLEQKIKGLIEETLGQARQEFEGRLHEVRERLEGLLNSELDGARQEMAAAAEEARRLAEEQEAARQREAQEAEEARRLAEEQEAARQREAQEAEEARRLAAEEDQAARRRAEEELEALRVRQSEEAEAKRVEHEEALGALNDEIGQLKAAIEEAEAARASIEAEAAIATQAATATATADTLRQLHRAVTEIDRAGSQTDLLQGLLTSSQEFAGRAVLLLTHEDGMHGWGQVGFELDDQALRDLRIDYPEGPGDAGLRIALGGLDLDENDCAWMCSHIDGSHPQGGALIPLVLRGRLAGVLYADHSARDAETQLPALQILTHVAALALETLPLRELHSTPTLRLASEATTEDQPLELWQFAVPEPVEPVVDTSGTAELPVAGSPRTVEAEPETQPSTEAISEVTAEFPEEVPAVEDFDVEAPEGMAVADEIDQDMAESTTVEPPPAVAEPEAPPVAALGDVEAAGFEMEPTTEVVPPPATEVGPPPDTEGAQVAPPQDLDAGPGWAFTTRSLSTEESPDAAHEEARRLARLLVTEIKLYNEEQVEEGRRAGNIYQSLRDDIDRSRQIYEERIDPTVRSQTDYFRQELVRILAAGDAEILGA